MDGGAGKGPAQMPPGSKFGARWWCSTKFKLHTPIHTRIHKGRNNNLFDNPMLWASVLGFFSQAPAQRRPLDSERRRRFAPTSALHYWKCGNEERGRRLEVVKLLTACVGGSFICPVFHH